MVPKYIGPLEPGPANTAVVTAQQARESGRREKAKPETAPEPDLTRAKSAHRMRHLPNAITIARILVTPVLLVLLLSGTLLGQFLALILFIGAAISDRKSTRLNSSHVAISYAVFCLKKKK